MALKPKDPPFLVVLRDGLAPLELEFLQQLTGGFKLKSGQKLRAVRGAAIESEGYFLRVDVVSGDDPPLPVRIPLSFVLAIIGEEKNAAPGFLTFEED